MPQYMVGKGQSMIVVALCAVLLVAIVGLAVDGGSTLIQRRNMQDGADAGVLAGARLLEDNLAASCNPAPCHPTYLISNHALLDRVTQLVNANRSGVLDQATYATQVEYHFLAGAPVDGDTYQPVANYLPGEPVPAFMDGLRVTTHIDNPTVFAQVVNIRVIPVSAAASVRLYGTCAAPDPPGPALPLTAFRPALEARLADPAEGNDACHPVAFGGPSGDVAGTSFANVVSLNKAAFHVTNGVITQTLSSYDERRGPPPPTPPAGGLGNWLQASLDPTHPYQDCSIAWIAACVDMRGERMQGGASAQEDVGNWLFWQWSGQVALTSTYEINTGTWAPATRQNGGQGTTLRPGDWAETYQGDFGTVPQDAVRDLTRLWGADTSLSPPVDQGGLNWGQAITRLVPLWGEATLPSQDSAQMWQNRAPIPGCTGANCQYTGWEDLVLSGNSGAYAAQLLPGGGSGPAQIDRVRFTRLVPVRFYSNLEGPSGAVGPLGTDGLTRCVLPNAGRSVWGLVLSTPMAGPSGPAACGWVPGGGVYYRLEDP